MRGFEQPGGKTLHITYRAFKLVDVKVIFPNLPGHYGRQQARELIVICIHQMVGCLAFT